MGLLHLVRWCSVPFGGFSSEDEINKMHGLLFVDVFNLELTFGVDFLLSQSSLSRPVSGTRSLVHLALEKVLAKLCVILELEFNRHVLKT